MAKTDPRVRGSCSLSKPFFAALVVRALVVRAKF